jgi:hypothetical protein
MPTGTALLDFGAFPGASDASVAVTGQTGILSTSLVEAWILPATTTDHSADEHRVETLTVMAGNIVAGTGFTIYGNNIMPSIPGGDKLDGYFTVQPRNVGVVYGKWNIAWAWL